MMIINVKNRMLSTEERQIYISDNTDYKVKFECDEEWVGKTKTARFICKNVYKDMILDTSNECVIPLEVLKPGMLKIGLFSAEYSTSELTVNVIPSIRAIMGKPLDYITEDLYRQILNRIDGIQAGEVSEEMLASAVQKYLEENPVSGAVTDEQIATAVEDYLKANPMDGSVSTEDIVKAVTAYMEENAESFKGESGENGATPKLTIGTVETLAAGSNATATITGTVEEPVLNLGIPRGKTGASGTGSGTATDNLAGKKILFIGDSICEGVGANGQPYPYWIEQWHENATVYNLGVAGMTVAQKDSSITNAMPVRIASGEFENADYSDADIIVFEGGINDFMNNVKLGYIQKSYDITKFNTFCRGMEYMFNYFKTLFPKARMIFCTTHNLTAYDFNKAQAWWGAASEICTKWGVEFLDLFALICTAKVYGLQLHPNYEVHRDYYAPFINRALVSETPLSGAKTTHYYALNAPCMLSFYSGTTSFSQNATISTSDWRMNMIRADLTTYVNVSSNVSYDLSDVDNTTEGVYPVHVGYSENGINLSTDVEITITGESVTKSLSSITATKTTTSYTVGSDVSTEDITVTANYTDGSTADVTASATFDTSNINNTTAGEYNIAISYTESDITKSTAIQINIVESGGESNTVVASGTAKDSNNQDTVAWSLDDNGVMTFDSTSSGTSMATYNEAERPWNDYITQITKAVFTSNIISTGSDILMGATNLVEVDLQGEIAVGTSAFKGCAALAEIDLTKVNYIGMYGFANCTSLPNEIVLGATALATQAFYYQPQITVIRFTGTPTSIASDTFSSVTGWNSAANLTDIYVPWSEGAVANAPWGATSATIHYNTTT